MSTQTDHTYCSTSTQRTDRGQVHHAASLTAWRTTRGERTTRNQALSDYPSLILTSREPDIQASGHRHCFGTICWYFVPLDQPQAAWNRRPGFPLASYFAHFSGDSSRRTHCLFPFAMAPVLDSIITHFGWSQEMQQLQDQRRCSGGACYTQLRTFRTVLRSTFQDNSGSDMLQSAGRRSRLRSRSLIAWLCQRLSDYHACATTSRHRVPHLVCVRTRYTVAQFGIKAPTEGPQCGSGSRRRRNPASVLVRSQTQKVMVARFRAFSAVFTIVVFGVRSVNKMMKQYIFLDVD